MPVKISFIPLMLLCLSQILILACSRDDIQKTEIILQKFDEVYNKNHTSLKIIKHEQVFSDGAILYAGDYGKNNSALIGQHLDYFKFNNLTLASESIDEWILQKPDLAMIKREKIVYPNASFYEIKGIISGNEYQESVEQTWCNNNSLFVWDSKYPEFIIESPGSSCKELASLVNPRWSPRRLMQDKNRVSVKEASFEGKPAYEFETFSKDFDISESTLWKKGTAYYDASSFLPIIFSVTTSDIISISRKNNAEKTSMTVDTYKLIQFDNAHPKNLFEAPPELLNLTRCMAKMPLYKFMEIINEKNAVKELCRHALLQKHEDNASVIINEEFFYQNMCIYDDSCDGYNQRTAVVCIADACINAEVADTPLRMQRGLMFRKSLSEDEGMLFVHDKEEVYSFWMKNTYIPLDMIWINNDSRIVHIEHAVPCNSTSECMPYTPAEVANYVLEVNAGFVNANKVKIGDEVTIKFD